MSLTSYSRGKLADRIRAIEAEFELERLRAANNVAPLNTALNAAPGVINSLTGIAMGGAELQDKLNQQKLDEVKLTAASKSPEELAAIKLAAEEELTGKKKGISDAEAFVRGNASPATPRNAVALMPAAANNGIATDALSPEEEALVDAEVRVSKLAGKIIPAGVNDNTVELTAAEKEIGKQLAAARSAIDRGDHVEAARLVKSAEDMYGAASAVPLKPKPKAPVPTGRPVVAPRAPAAPAPTIKPAPAPNPVITPPKPAPAPVAKTVVTPTPAAAPAAPAAMESGHSPQQLSLQESITALADANVPNGEVKTDRQRAISAALVAASEANVAGDTATASAQLKKASEIAATPEPAPAPAAAPAASTGNTGNSPGWVAAKKASEGGNVDVVGAARARAQDSATKGLPVSAKDSQIIDIADRAAKGIKLESWESDLIGLPAAPPARAPQAAASTPIFPPDRQALDAQTAAEKRRVNNQGTIDPESVPAATVIPPEERRRAREEAGRVVKYATPFEIPERNFRPAEEVADEIIDEIYGAPPAKRGEPWDTIWNIMTLGGNDRDTTHRRLAKKLAARAVIDRQDEIIKKDIELAEKRTKLSETANTAKINEANIIKGMKEVKAYKIDSFIDSLYENNAPMIDAIAIIQDPEQRATAVDKLFAQLPDNVFGDVGRGAIKRQLIEDMRDYGEEWANGTYDRSKAKASRGGAGGEGRGLPATEARGLADITSTVDNVMSQRPTPSKDGTKALLRQIMETTDPTKISSLLAQAYEQDPEFAANDAAARINMSNYLKQQSGAAVNDTEVARLYAAAPNATDPPGVFYAKLVVFTSALDNIYRRRVKAYRSAGYEMGGYDPEIQASGMNDIRAAAARSRAKADALRTAAGE